jgi:predicted MPP superfamily phosphohydrolase
VAAPLAWAGKRILHLTDLHLIPHSRETKRIRAGIEGIRCDVIAITGDILEHEDSLGDLKQILEGVECDGPKIAVLGNHDLHGDRGFRIYGHHPAVEFVRGRVCITLANRLKRYAEERPERRPDEAERIRAAIESIGIPVLMNQAAPIVNWNDAWVLGLNDPYSGADDLTSALLDLPSGARPLGLVHAPGPAPAMVRAGAFLVLSGHTHGNQVYLPGTDSLMRLGAQDWQPRYGVFRQPGGTIIVSSGAGHLLPIRIACPPEVWVADLVAALPARREKARRRVPVVVNRGAPVLASKGK